MAFAGLALLFLQLDAQFAGFAQILVYVGAVAILVVFAILLTRGSETPKDGGIFSRTWLAGLVIAAAVFAVLAWAVIQSAGGLAGDAPAPTVSVLQIGQALMGRYVLPLEIVALLLTAALIGAVIVAMHEKEECEVTPLAGYLLVAALLFAIGLAGALTRRNAILVLIGIELMLNAANLNLIAFWRYGPHPEALTGMMFAIFSIAVAAAEAAVGLGLVISVHRHLHTADLDEMNRMKG